MVNPPPGKEFLRRKKLKTPGRGSLQSSVNSSLSTMASSGFWPLPWPTARQRPNKVHRHYPNTMGNDNNGGGGNSGGDDDRNGDHDDSGDMGENSNNNVATAAVLPLKTVLASAMTTKATKYGDKKQSTKSLRAAADEGQQRGWKW